jgi:hypothetical protein
VTRSLCLTVCGVQLAIFLAFFGILPLSKAAGFSPDMAQSIFQFSALLLVFLFPFGFASLFLTIGYYAMREYLGYSQESFERSPLGWSMMRFFVWIEVRSQLAEVRSDKNG